WRPAPPVSPAEWVRRVTYDLTGLPPTPEEVAAFTRDAAPDARERLVERLLASPRYGERFAQLWLDLVRYAETEGFEYDRLVPGAWRYRDYVIEAFNRDRPYDQFLTEQLAGDELMEGGDKPAEVGDGGGKAPRQAATILHRLGPVRRNAGNPEIALSRNEVLTERTNIVGDAFLGLTIGCARCHNHKLEPISQRDYYRLQAYFAATEEHDIVLASDEQQRKWRRTTERIQGQIKQLQEQAKTATLDEQARLRREVEQIEATLPEPLPTIPAIQNVPSTRTPIHVLRRGVWELKGPAVGPRPPDVLVAPSVPELPADAESPRSHLARWLTDRRHPLTARVMVNRLWQHHFGQGLVRTANDFGTHGDVPSHPELLDWLAAQLVRHDWQLKPLHRLIVLSSTYAQSSDASTHVADDPENRLLWRFDRRRLSADEIRDALLAVSDELNLRMGGPSVLVPVDEELVGLLYKPSQWQVTADPYEHRRRTVYLLAKRNLRLPFLEAFDSPALQTSCPRRETSTHAPQALELLNGPLANELARCLADRLRRETGEPADGPSNTQAGERAERIVERAFQLTQGRSPSGDELRLSLEFLAHQPLSEFALAVLNLNGFVYVP
ncbi:MAG: DUF1553 domain-containing protein, partial [Pirellulaceae bacterium]|nr:DUF1553 domain-containing protein [Pirellulaceae bacterium]